MENNHQPQAGTFVSEEGANVAYKNWKAAEQPKAVVVLAHGFNSHSGYYQWTAQQLTAQSYEVYAIDFPGRGQSDGERYYIADYEQFVKELDKLVNKN